MDIEHPLSRRGSQGQTLDDGYENMDIRCKSGVKKRRVSGQNEESPFKVQLKHRDAEKEAGFN